MELAIIIVICVIVVVLALVSIVFCRSAGKAQNEQLAGPINPAGSPTGSMQSMQQRAQWTMQQQMQNQQPTMLPQMQPAPFPPQLQMTPQQMQQMTPQQIQHMQQMQQMWQMQQMQQMQQQMQQIQMRNGMNGQQQQQPMNPYFQKTPMNPNMNMNMNMMPPQQVLQMQQQQQMQQQGMMASGAAGLGASGIKTNSGSGQDTAKFFPELVPHRLDETEVTMTRKISTGSFGIVWLGHYHGQPVAVKKMINGEEEAQLFAKEILIMARMNHPKIVKFLGCTWTQPADLGAVTEFMNGGDVRTLLENKRIELSWQKEKISIAIDIAEAIKYMHTLSPKLIHRDLKSRNVLLNSQMVAKLSDFGLSRNRTYEQTLTAGVGTVRWTAPEVMLGDQYSEQADIYSFGVVLSELDTREIPFEETSGGKSGGGGGLDMNIVIKVAKGELRPSFSKDVPPCIDHIARACLQFDPALRPTATQVVTLLNNAKAELIQ